nr:HalX domain-containing protein [Halorarius halobius]
MDAAVPDRQLPDGTGNDIVAGIRERDLDCGIAFVTAAPPEQGVSKLEFDEYLRKPVRRDELRDTVDRLVRMNEYGHILREFFAVTGKKSLLEAHHPRSELEQQDEYQQLVAREAELEDDLAEIAARFTPDQLTAICSQVAEETYES